MSLASCIRKAGGKVSPQDKAFLKAAIDNGATDPGALMLLQRSVNAANEQIAKDSGMDLAVIDPAAETKSSILRKIWGVLGSFEAAHQYPISDEKSLADMVDDYSAAIIEIPSDSEDFKNYKVVNEKVSKVHRLIINHGVMMKAANKKWSEVFVIEAFDEIYVDVSDMPPGGGGSEIYAMVANYAYNNGLKFIGDPAGLSPLAQHRRLENMISSALKFNTTDHIKPHPYQMGKFMFDVDRDAVTTTGFLDGWSDGDTEGNMEKMLLLSYNNHLKYIPEIADYHYDFTTDEFRHRATGDILTGGRADELRRSPGGETLGTGSNTLKRAIFTHSILSEEGSRERDAWVDAASTKPLPLSLRDVLYQSHLGYFSNLSNLVDTMSIPAWRKTGIGYQIQSTYDSSNMSQPPYESREAAEAKINSSDANPDHYKVVEVEVPGRARGEDIWNKIKSGGVKVAELQWVGIEEYLTSDPDYKFTRQQVQSYLTSNGVQIEETIAVENPDGGDIGDIDWGDITVDSDSANWQHRVEDYEYEWDNNDEAPYFFDENQQREYIEEYLTDELIKKFIETQVFEDEVADPNHQKDIDAKLARLPDPDSIDYSLDYIPTDVLQVYGELRNVPESRLQRANEQWRNEDEAGRRELIAKTNETTVKLLNDREAALISPERDAMEATLEAMGPEELYDYVENEGRLYPLEELRDDLEKEYLERAEKAAEEEYRSNPYITQIGETPEGKITINGNDDIGYSIRSDEGHDISSHGEVWSLNEAQIEAQTWAMDQGWLTEKIDSEQAQWDTYVGEYVPHDNYREIKLKLPEAHAGDRTFEHSHFGDDSNLITFLRTTDRELYSTLPDSNAASTVLRDSLPKHEDIDYDDPNLPRWVLNIWKSYKAAFSNEMFTSATVGWRGSTPEKRRAFVDSSNQKIIDKHTHGRLTPDEMVNGQDPGVQDQRRMLEEMYGEERMSAMQNSAKESLQLLITDVGIHPERYYADKIDIANDLVSDQQNWPIVASTLGVDNPTAFNQYASALTTKKQLEETIERADDMYNSIENKLQRAGKTPTTTFHIDEFQSDWASEIRKKGLHTGEHDPGDLDLLVEDIWRPWQTKLEEWFDQEIVEEGDPRLWIEQYDPDNKLTVTEFLDHVVDKMGLDKEQFMKDMVEADKITEQANAERDGEIDMPFKGDLWLPLGLKRAITLAVEEGYDSISWPNGSALKTRWSQSYEYGPQYDQKMPSIVKKLTKVKPVEMDFEGNAIDRVPEPRIDTSGWTVKKTDVIDPATMRGYDSLNKRQFTESMFDYMRGGGKYSGDKPSSSRWEIEIPELGMSKVMDDQHERATLKVVSEKDMTLRLIKLHEKKIRLLEFYDIKQINDDYIIQAKEGVKELNAPFFSSIEEAANYLVSMRYEKHFPKTPDGYWVIPVEEDLKERVKNQGFPLFQDERGRYYPGEGDSIIQLTKTSDLSTFLHESGHLYLDLQRTWSKKYGMTDDHRVILKWLGINNFDEVTREHHEKWAETFESYLLEGKAPSLKLRQAFAAFARWLKQIYKHLTDTKLRRADLTTEISGVFDRMLATQEEIAEAAAHPEYDQYFKSQAQAGMSDHQWAEYQKRRSSMKDGAEKKLDEKILKQYMRAKTAEWKNERAPMIEEEREKLGKLPIYQILADVAGDKKNNVPGVPFNTDDVKAIYPDGIPKKLSFRHAREGGIDPDWYAEAYGISSGRELLKQIVDAPSLKEAATEAAEARMVDKYGDIFTDGTLEAEAREALINDDQAALLQMEINAMRPKAGINREYLKAQAAILIGGMKYNEIKPSRYYHTMVKAAQDTVRMSDPTDAKIQQLSNHYLYREAIRVREQMKKHQTFVKQQADRKFDTKKVDSEYVNQIKLVSKLYDMRQSPHESNIIISNILSFYRAQLDRPDGDPNLKLVDPNLVNALAHSEEHGNLNGFRPILFKDMTAQDLHGVVDMIKHLRFVGGQIANSVNQDVIDERLELVESIHSNGGKDFPVKRGSKRPYDNWKRWSSGMINKLPSIINMTRKLDGMEGGGKAYKSILVALDNANNKKMEMQRRFYEMFEIIAGDLSDINLSMRDATVYQMENGGSQEFTSEQRFMIALYWGTESSREAIRQGHGLTDRDVNTILSDLTVDQLNMVKVIWQMNESHWPQLQEAAIKQDGYAPPKLDYTPFSVNGVNMAGGHMQLMYDSQSIELANERDVGSKKGSVMPTKAGSANARVGSGGKPVNLDINNITKSVDDKIHFIAFADAGRSLRRLLNADDVKHAIERKHGSGFLEAYMQAIEAVTTQRIAQESWPELAKMSRWGRQSATMMHLMYSIRNTVQQASALPIVMAEVGAARFIQSSSAMLSNPAAMVQMINEKSEFMRNRATLINRDSHEAMKKYVSTSKLGAGYQSFKTYGFTMQIMVDSTIAYPTWLAAYQKSMDLHGDEKRARIDADSSVGESVGSGSDMHLGRAMQSNQSEFVKTMTVFGSWFNAYFQRIYKSSKGGTDYLNSRVLLDAVILPMIAANMAQALILDMPDTGGEEDETWLDWMFKNYVGFMAGTIPIMRELVSYHSGFEPSVPVLAFPKALDRMFKETSAYVEDRQTGMKTAIDYGKTVATVTKVPGSGQLLRALDYIESYMEGEEKDTFNIWQMFVEGADKDAK